MLDARGSLWTWPAEARVITTNGAVKANGACVMGRGCAQQARDRWPGLDLRLGDLLTVHGNRAFRLKADLLSFPVKHHWKDHADPELIVRSAHQLVELIDKFDIASVVMPRPGCGNGKLSWYQVMPLIEPILDDRITVITFPKIVVPA